MTCAQFKKNVGSLALDALDPNQAVACRAHLRNANNHDGCVQSWHDKRHAVSHLAHAVSAVKLRPGLWRGIEERVSPHQGRHRDMMVESMASRHHN